MPDKVPYAGVFRRRQLGRPGDDRRQAGLPRDPVLGGQAAHRSVELDLHLAGQSGDPVLGGQAAHRSVGFGRPLASFVARRGVVLGVGVLVALVIARRGVALGVGVLVALVITGRGLALGDGYGDLAGGGVYAVAGLHGELVHVVEVAVRRRIEARRCLEAEFSLGVDRENVGVRAGQRPGDGGALRVRGGVGRHRAGPALGVVDRRVAADLGRLVDIRDRDGYLERGRLPTGRRGDRDRVGIVRVGIPRILEVRRGREAEHAVGTDTEEATVVAGQ